MRYRLGSFFLGGALLAATGCALHPPYGALNDNTSLIPPIGKLTHKNTLPPAAMLMHPGPGVDGPGPGVMMGDVAPPMPMAISQVQFVSPDGMSVAWDVSAPGAFDSEPLIAPARYNFAQGAIYRLKLTTIPGRPGVELYPTVEIGPATPRTAAYLEHNSIPMQFTEEDFDQVLSGNFVTKVIYLPDPEFQELALAGVETLVSTRLDPGLDPIVEADRRGAILAIIRVGNKDLEIPGGDIVGAGMGGNGGVDADGNMQASYCPPGMGGAGVPGLPNGVPPGFVAGVTSPQYGMPISGTPIGLPGPPHIPLGIPAGLQSHVVKNHTKMHIPGPSRNVKINVQQKPGLSYPQPANKAWIVERTHTPPVLFRQPRSDKHEFIEGDNPGAAQCD